MRLEDLVLVSVDDHVVEPPDLFEGRLSAKHAEVAPRLVRKESGIDVWQFMDAELPNIGLNAVAGRPPEEYAMDPQSFDDMRTGCYDIHDRVKDMNANGLLGSMCFPSFPQFCGQLFARAATKDEELATALVRAYNDWHIESWCGAYPGRFIPLALPMMWDVEKMAAEVRRVADKGCFAVTFSENPVHLGFPSIHSGHWDPFFAACQETETVVCMHIGSSSQMPSTSADAPVAVAATLSFNNSMASLADFLFSGVLVRFDSLKLAYSEGQIGWLPYVLERVDDVWREHRAWGGVRDLIPEPPSTYYFRQVFGCFFRDRHGLEALHRVGVDNVTFETDYPHTDTTWPDTKAVAEDMMRDLPDDVVYKLVRGNAIRMLSLDVV